MLWASASAVRGLAHGGSESELPAVPVNRQAGFARLDVRQALATVEPWPKPPDGRMQSAFRR